MTSEVGVEEVVEDQFFFHCSCGASFETSSTKVTREDCGETIEVLQCVPTATGKKYKLRISRQRRDWNTELALWPPVLTIRKAPLSPHPHLEFDPGRFRSNITGLPPRHHEARDHNERCLRLGSLILLAPLWVPLLLFVVSGVFAPATIEPREGLIVEPQPTDCGLFSGCHYQQRTRDEKGYTIVTWERVND